VGSLSTHASKLCTRHSVRPLDLIFVFLKVMFWTNGVEFSVSNVFQSCTDFEVHPVQHMIYKSD